MSNPLLPEVVRSGLRPISEKIRRAGGALTASEAFAAAWATLRLTRLHEDVWEFQTRKLARGVELKELDEATNLSLACVEVTSSTLARLTELSNSGRFTQDEASHLQEVVAEADVRNRKVHEQVAALAEQL